MVHEKLDAAGFMDTRGRLSKPVPPGHILIPAYIELRGSDLLWKFGGSKAKSIQPNRGEVLDAFIKLHAASPDRILGFARKWGVLVLDDDGRPAGPWIPSGREPLELWRKLSRRAEAVLKIAAGLQQKRLPTREDAKCLLGPELGSWPPYSPELRIIAKKGEDFKIAWVPELLRMELDIWLWRGHVTFGPEWRRSRGQWETGMQYYGHLLGALALQLLLTVTHGGLYVCSGCGSPYIRSEDQRRPKHGQDNFCPGCGVAAALRLADHRRKERMAEARRLHKAGVPITEIAEKIGSRLDSVRRWVK